METNIWLFVSLEISKGCFRSFFRRVYTTSIKLIWMTKMIGERFRFLVSWWCWIMARFLRKFLFSPPRAPSIVLLDSRKQVLNKQPRYRVQCSIFPWFTRNRTLCLHKTFVGAAIDERNRIYSNSTSNLEEKVNGSAKKNETVSGTFRADKKHRLNNVQYVSSSPRTFFPCDEIL